MIPVADGHCDFLYGVVNHGYDFERPHLSQQNIARDRLKQGNVKMQFFAAWTDMALRLPPLQQCLAMIDAYYAMHQAYPCLRPLTKNAQTDPQEQDVIDTVLTIEGGEAIEGSLSVLRMLHRLGVRAMALTWNSNNELSGAALGRGNKGLSSLGVEVVEEMGRIGMAVDVSHLSDRGIDEVLHISTRPVFASHSNCREVYASPRSLTDEQIRAIAAQGGTIGINFYHKQLTSHPHAEIADIVAQLSHLAGVGGVDCCAIGSDFDGMPKYPVDLQTSADFPALVQALLTAGFSSSDVEKIMYQNLHRYILQFI